MSELGSLEVVINGRDVGLSRLLRQVERELRASDAAAQRSTNETLQLSSAYGRLASALGQPAAGAAQLRSTLESLTNVETRQAVAIQTQIARLDQQAARMRSLGSAGAQSAGGLNQLASAASGVNALLGAAGFAVGTQQVIQFGQASIQAGLSLARVENSLRTLSGSQAAYANVVAIARQQQSLFGGTLEDNLSDLTSFTVLARSSGAELNSLVDLAQRLATFDPGQGLRGASAALRELLAGNPNALAARFELPKAALAAIKDESATTTDRLRILNEVLNDAGITSELVATSVPQATKAFNDLAAQLERIQLAGGKIGGNLLAPFAAGATSLLGGTPDFSGAGAAFGEGIADLTGKTGTARAQLVAFNSALFPIITNMQSATGSTDRFIGVLSGFVSVVARAPAPIRDWILAMAQASPTALLVADATDQVAVGYNGAAQAAIAGAQASRDAAAAANEAAAAHANAAGQALIDEVNTRIVAEEKRRLQEAAQAAANGVLTSGANIEAEAARLAASSSLIDQLTAAYLRLAVATGEADRQQRAAAGSARLAAQAAQTRDRTGGGLGFNAPGRGRGSDADILDTMTRTQGELARAQEDGENKRTGAAARGGATRARAQADIDRRSLDQERDYQDRRTEIAREGAEKRAEAERQFAQQQRGDRASFYERLADIDDNGVRQGLSARFEAANAEAARIAQEQGADAAAAYLDAAQQAIESEAQLEQKIREAQASGDTATAEFLQGVLKLRQEANAAELQAIKNKGSTIAAEEARQYAESERQYAEHLDRLAGIAAQKGVTLGQTLPPATVAGGAGTTPGRPTTTTPAVPPTTTPTTAGRAQPVEDIATPGAIDTQTARLEGRLSALLGAVEQVAREVASVRGAIEGLKRSPAFSGA